VPIYSPRQAGKSRTAAGRKWPQKSLVSGSDLGFVRFALNPCGLGGIGWVSIPNKSKSFTIFSNPIQSIWDRNNRTSPYSGGVPPCAGLKMTTTRE
jgi:hypothetical protein